MMITNHRFGRTAAVLTSLVLGGGAALTPTVTAWAQPARVSAAPSIGSVSPRALTTSDVKQQKAATSVWVQDQIRLAEHNGTLPSGGERPVTHRHLPAASSDRH